MRNTGNVTSRPDEGELNRQELIYTGIIINTGTWNKELTKQGTINYINKKMNMTK